MGSIVRRIKDWWQDTDRTQRVVTLTGIAVLVVLLGATAYFASRPRFQPVFSGLSLEDQGMVVEELNAIGIPVEIRGQGTVLVPADKVVEAQMKLASAKKLPNSNTKGLEWLDGINSFSTPAQERERITAALEGELAKSIETLAGVAAARVHIASGKDSPFADDVVLPTAVVNVTEMSTGSISPDQARAMARLVQNKVTGLTESGVSVVTNDGRLIFDGAEQGTSEALASRKLSAEISESKRREKELQRRLDTAFGPGNTIVTVQVELDMDAVAQSEKSLEFGDKKVSEQSKETMTEESSGSASGAAGIDTNTPTAAGVIPGSSKGVKYSSETTANQFPSLEKKVDTTRAPGSLISMTVSVIANSAKIEDTALVEEIATSYLGDKQGKPGFVSSVQAVEFDTTTAEERKKAEATAASQAQVQQVISLLPVAALLVVGFMVVKALGKLPGKTLTMALPDGGTIAISPSSAPSLSNQTVDELPATSKQLTSVAELAKTEPEIAEALQQMGVEHIDDTVDVDAIRARIDIPLEQIRKMARQRPQAIALLLKGWMMEERK